MHHFLYNLTSLLNPLLLLIVMIRVHIKLQQFLEKKWFLTLIDDHTRVCWVYLLKKKSNDKQIFKNFTLW